MTIQIHEHLATLLAAPNLPSERRALDALLDALHRLDVDRHGRITDDVRVRCALVAACDKHPFKDVETRLSLCWHLVYYNPFPSLS